MPVYTIHYNTVNKYEPSFREALLEFLIIPLENTSQHLIDMTIHCYPLTDYFFSKNIYGFDTLRCRLQKNAVTFELHFTATIEKEEKNPFIVPILSVEEEHAILNAKEMQIDNHYFLHTSHYTTPADKWYPPVIGKDETVFEFVKKINELVHSSIAYNPDHASVHNTLEDVLENCQGVCQDFTHLMIAILRRNNIPARYVSGYLNQGVNYDGDNAIHAWVEALIPGTGWVGFDPTNNLLEDHHYIKIAHGVDFSECTSLKGVVKAKGIHRTNYEVKVQELHYNSSDQ